jgi:4-hydroxy-tetrahydrodipicolinate synthase
MLMPHLAAGAVGIISVCSHVIGPQIAQIIAAYNDGKVDEAQRIFLEYLPLMTTIMTVTASPIPVKAALNLLGVSVGAPRLPLVDATEEEKGTIRTAMERAGLL